MPIQSFADIGQEIVRGRWGRSDYDSLGDAIKSMDAGDRTMCLLAALIRSVDAVNASNEAVRREIARLPAKLEKQRLAEELKLATAERKAAEAREKAALAELQAKQCEPPVLYTCSNEELDHMPPHMIRRRF
jgi:hypothetical protein